MTIRASYSQGILESGQHTVRHPIVMASDSEGILQSELPTDRASDSQGIIQSDILQAGHPAVRPHEDRAS